MAELDPFEEDRLRARLQEAVKSVVPSPDALDRLREEVPHRKGVRALGVVTVAGLVAGGALAADAVQQIF